jgi:3-hydroxyisobutyrate dehydrogenase-like beta-hydroxyacid dehydrogenase
MSTPPSPEPALVGFIGLGMIGAPIAERLQAAGHPLVVHNRTREKAEPLLSRGARWAFTPRDVGRAATAKMVFTAVTDARALDRILFGRAGLARGLSSGSLLVDLSTIAPDQTRAFAAQLSAQGVHLVDASLGGSVEAARNGRLLVFAGGSDEDVARARPFLNEFARRVEHLGPVGAGTSMKLVNNLLALSYVALAGEALALAERLGLDRRRVIDLLLDGGGYSRLFEQKRLIFEERRYPAQFLLRLAEKDLKLITHTAHRAGGEAALAHEAGRLVSEAVRAGHGEEDFSAVFEAAIARRAPVRAPPSPVPSSGPETNPPPG